MPWRAKVASFADAACWRDATSMRACERASVSTSACVRAYVRVCVCLRARARTAMRLPRRPHGATASARRSDTRRCRWVTRAPRRTFTSGAKLANLKSPPETAVLAAAGATWQVVARARARGFGSNWANRRRKKKPAVQKRNTRDAIGTLTRARRARPGRTACVRVCVRALSARAPSHRCRLAPGTRCAAARGRTARRTRTHVFLRVCAALHAMYARARARGGMGKWRRNRIERYHSV